MWLRGETKQTDELPPRHRLDALLLRGNVRRDALLKTGTVYNIVGVYALADHIDKSEGLTAYEKYHGTMAAFAEAYGKTVEVVAGIFSALSPVNDYWGNLRSMKSVLVGYAEGLPVEKVKCTTSHKNRGKAWDIVTGKLSPLESLGGKKTRNFWMNLVDPKGRHAVTIDRHALSVWMGNRDPRGDVGTLYDRIADAYREAAQRLGVAPCQVQAVTWFTWKRLNGLVYNGQTDIFHQGNQWRNSVTPDEVRLFP